jgi:hypothetical protein
LVAELEAERAKTRMLQAALEEARQNIVRMYRDGFDSTRRQTAEHAIGHIDWALADPILEPAERSAVPTATVSALRAPLMARLEAIRAGSGCGPYAVGWQRGLEFALAELDALAELPEEET